MLVEQINKDLIDAMKAKDEVKLRAIRAIKSAFLLAGTETGSKDINDETAIKAMQKMAKQRKDSIDIFLKENRQDLAKKEQEELVVIEQYLPPSMSEQDLIAALKDIIASTGASSMKDIGKVMPVAMKSLAGKTDGKAINDALKTLLS
ncbi:MAG: hypothetical protein RLZZ60_1338 [Bacteroidota bacterium]|jgi:uncharacterized protein YqeY